MQTLIWLFLNVVVFLKCINEQHVTHFPQMNPQESGSYSPSLKIAIAKTCKSSRKTIHFCFIMYHIWGWGVWGREEKLSLFGKKKQKCWTCEKVNFSSLLSVSWGVSLKHVLPLPTLFPRTTEWGWNAGQ